MHTLMYWFVQVSGNDEVFAAGLQAVVQLSAVVGPALIPHLKILLSSVNCVLAFYFSAFIVLLHLAQICTRVNKFL